MNKCVKLWKKRSALALVLTVALTVCCIFTGCSNENAQTDPAESTEKTEILMEETIAEPAGYVIPTPVGDLEFPGEWADRIRLEDVSADGLYAVNLYGSVGQQEALLFTIYMGTPDVGYYYGAAPNAEGEMVEIYIQIESFSPDETWSEDAANEISSMQSRVNDLIAQLNELPGFIPG